MKILKKITSLLLIAVMLLIAFSGCSKKEEKVPAGSVTLGTTTTLTGDWTYGDFSSSENITDKQIINLTDDGRVIQTDEGGDYVVNTSLIKNYSRKEDKDGNVTYKFTIQKGLQFNNGDPIYAENFIAWTLFILSPTAREMGAYIKSAKNILGAESYRNGESTELKGLRLINKYKFSVTIAKQDENGNDNYPYYYELSYIPLRAVSIDYWFGNGWKIVEGENGTYFKNSDDSKEFNADNISQSFDTARYADGNRVSCGAYDIVSYDKDSSTVSLSVNANYPGDFSGEKPGIKDIKILCLDTSEIYTALREGSIDMVTEITGTVEIKSLVGEIEQGELDRNYCTFDRAGYSALSFSCDFGPTQFVKFRQAMEYIFDSDEYIETLYGDMAKKVYAPYCTSFNMYTESSDIIENKLNHYDTDIDKALELLCDCGFIYNEKGEKFDSEKDKLRYKKVSSDEAKGFEDYCVTIDDAIYMPAQINWATTQDSVSADIIEKILDGNIKNNNLGINIIKSEMPYTSMLNYMYRSDIYNLGGSYNTPNYNMFNISINWSNGVYDYSDEFTHESSKIADGYNSPRIYDSELQTLSEEMITDTKYTDKDDFNEKWQQFILRYNELAIQIPICSETYITIIPKTISDYSESAFWDYSRALLYCSYTDK